MRNEVCILTGLTYLVSNLAVLEKDPDVTAM
jgi:hypothetical protein